MGTHNPTVSNATGTAVNFGSNTAITFANGVATVTGTNNGVMTLYKVGAANIVVSDGTINNGTGLAVTVGAGNAADACRSARRRPRRQPGRATTSPSPRWTPSATPPRPTRGLTPSTFGGANASPNGSNPTVTNATGTAVSFRLIHSRSPSRTGRPPSRARATES